MQNFGAYKENLKCMVKESISYLNNKLEAWYKKIEEQHKIIMDLDVLNKAREIEEKKT